LRFLHDLPHFTFLKDKIILLSSQNDPFYLFFFVPIRNELLCQSPAIMICMLSQDAALFARLQYIGHAADVFVPKQKDLRESDGDNTKTSEHVATAIHISRSDRYKTERVSAILNVLRDYVALKDELNGNWFFV